MSVLIAYEVNQEDKWRIDEIVADSLYFEYETVGTVAVLKDANGETVKKLDGDDPRPHRVLGELRVT